VDCARCEELLIASLDGRAAASEHVATQRAHLTGCERCRELERLLAGAPEATPPADLTESILAATSSRWASVFEQLDADLPCLASMEPNAAFLGDVLAATTGSRRVALWQQVAGRAKLAELWQRLVTRPRLALEGAWVGALALVLITGIQAPRLDASPVETLAEIRQERVEPAIDSAFDQLVELGGQTRAAATARARGVWTSRLAPVIEAGRRVWCESFGCEPTDDNTNESNRGGTDER